MPVQTSGSLPFILGTQELLGLAVADNGATTWSQIAPPDLGLAPGHHGMVTSPHIVVLNTTTRPKEGPWLWLWLMPRLSSQRERWGTGWQNMGRGPTLPQQCHSTEPGHTRGQPSLSRGEFSGVFWRSSVPGRMVM